MQPVREKQVTQLCQIIQPGLISYQEAWEWQRQLITQRSHGQGCDTLLLLEHPPTITLGRAAKQQHIIASHEELARQGVALIQSDRGGDVTYHAPGQLVGYPILKLTYYGGNVIHYVRTLEEIIIRTLAHYHIVGKRIEGLTGVWVDNVDNHVERKIAAIGVRLSASGITSHGFALNIAPDLRGFQHIIPCGIRNRQVTSMEQELQGHAPPWDEVVSLLIDHFVDLFQITPHYADNLPIHTRDWKDTHD